MQSWKWIGQPNGLGWVGLDWVGLGRDIFQIFWVGLDWLDLNMGWVGLVRIILTNGSVKIVLV